MWARITSNEIWAKTLRIVLVFSLVFWASFRVECLAYAALVLDDGEHENDALSDVAVWQLDSEDETKLGEIIQTARGTANGDEQTRELKMPAGGALKFVAVPEWVEPQVETVAVPNVAGKTVAAAIEDMEDAGLEFDYGEFGLDWIVESTDPAAGSEVERGSTVFGTFREPEVPGGDEPGGDEPGGDEPADGGGDEPGDEPGGDGYDSGDSGSGGGSDEGFVDVQSVDDEPETYPTPPAPRAQAKSAQTRGTSPDPDGGEDVGVAGFMEWKARVGEEYADDIISFDPVTGVATLEPREAGTVIVTCSLPEGFDPGRIAPDFESRPFTVSFNVTVTRPYVDHIELREMPGSGESLAEYAEDPNPGGQFDQGSPIVLSDSQRESFAFWARVVAFDELSGTFTNYDVGTGDSLSKKSGGLFSDLTWRILDESGEAEVGEDVASITSDGVLTLRGDGPVRVECRSEEGVSGNPWFIQCEVRSDKAEDQPEDIQGESNPQETLTVVINDPSGLVGAPEGFDDADGDSAESETQNPSGEAGSEGEGAQSSEAHANTQTEKVFVATDSGGLAERLESGELGAEIPPRNEGQSEFTAKTAEGSTTVLGVGPAFPNLLQNCGLGTEEQKRIASITFKTAGGTATTITKDELVAISIEEKNEFPIIATKSFVKNYNGQEAGASVQGEGEGQGESEEGQPEEGTDGAEGDMTPVDNTKYRFLYNSTDETAFDKNPLDFRWIHTIEVTLKEKESDEEEPPKQDDKLRVRIGYVKVLKGEKAKLTAETNQEAAKDTFGYTWEYSSDGETNWKEYPPEEENGMSISPLTDDPPAGHIGHYFRVTLTSNMLDEDGKPRIYRSGDKDVRIEPLNSDPDNPEKADWSAELSYNPPVAGSYASFRVIVHNCPWNESELKYYWEIDYGDGKGFVDNKLATHESTWGIDTNPIDESSGTSGPSDEVSNPLIKHQVKVVAPNGDYRYTQIVDFLVQTPTGGQDDHNSGGDNDDNPFPTPTPDSDPDPDSEPNPFDEDENPFDEDEPFEWGPSVDDIDPNPEENPEFDPEEDLEPIEEPVEEEERSSIADYMEDAPTVDPSTTGDHPQILVNDKVTEEIKKQQQEVKKHAEDTTPGAHWKVSKINPTEDDIEHIFEDNPFYPLTLPVGCGVVFAGGIEKLLAFRRQL